MKSRNPVRKVILALLLVYGQEHREAVASAKEEQLDALKKSGMTVNESPDLDAFKEATRTVYTSFELQNAWTSDLVAKIRVAGLGDTD